MLYLDCRPFMVTIIPAIDKGTCILPCFLSIIWRGPLKCFVWPPMFFWWFGVFRWTYSYTLQLYVTVIPDSYGLHPFGGLLAAYKVGLLLCWFACLWLDYELLICWFLRVVELRTTHFLVCMCVVGQRATNLLVCMCVVGRTTHLLVCMCIVGLRATHLLVCMCIVGLRATHLLVCIVLLDYELLICWCVCVLLDYELLICWFV